MQIGLYAIRFVLVAAATAAPWIAHAADKATRADTAQLARGRYIALVSGCNDCHTAGYASSGGKVPEAEWLKGDILGWRGPWGTTYPSNLRMYMQKLTEAQWVIAAKALQTRPPMPWFAVREMSDGDLRALYTFVRHLGPGGQAAPAFVPPDKEPPPPFVLFPAPAK